MLLIIVFAFFTHPLIAAERPVAKTLCTATARQVNVSVQASYANQTLILPVRTDEASFYQKGGKTGCAAVLAHAKLSSIDLPSSVLTGLAATTVFHAQLPAYDGMAFELGFDVLVLRKSDGTLVAGPSIRAGGMENEVTNHYDSISETEISLRQKSSGEGQVTESALRLKLVNGKWQPQKQTSR